MICLTSSLAFSATFVLYQGSTSIPILELVAMSMSGVLGIFSTKIFNLSKYASAITATMLFVIAPMFLLSYDRKLCMAVN